MSFAPSGEQFEISFASQRATVVEVGGGIREYLHGDREVLESYSVQAICDGAHGAPLIPWPNRIAEGRYSFEGSEQQLALSEPARGNAIHGLLRWRPWQALEHSPSRVVMGARLHPMTGYPFALDVRIAYELSELGLGVSTTATNVGESSCPYGCGQHPYLSPGPAAGTIDECSLELPAATRLVNEEEHQVPVSREPVEGGAFDYRRARVLRGAQLDDAFTELERDGEGIATARLRCPDGHCVELWVDGAYPFLEVFSGDTLAPERRRHALAVEPMSCAPNALRSGDGLLMLAPGETASGLWGVALSTNAAAG
jgi:aldose 1-epimerase